MKSPPYKKLRAVAVSLLTGVSAFSANLVPSHAETYTIPDNGNLYELAPATTGGDAWELNGNAYVFNGVSGLAAKTLPMTLTISGASGGSVITMTDGADHYAYFDAAESTVVTLSDVTFTGGNNTTHGGVFDAFGTLIFNTTGTVAFANNTSAIRAIGAVTVNGSLSARDNTTTTTIADPGGSVIYAKSGSITITDSVDLSSNTTAGNGGAIWAAGLGGTGVSIGNSESTVSLANNRAGYDAGGATANAKVQGGAILAAQAVSISGHTITISENWANSGGGGIASLFGAIDIGGSESSVAIRDNRSGYNRDGSRAFGGGGGAIWAGVDGSVTISGASIILFDNWATMNGGGIASGRDVTIGGAGGTVILIGNHAGYEFDGTAAASDIDGGAINTGTITTLSGQTITVIGNMATRNGGGIYATGGVFMGAPGSAVTITGNRSGYDADGLVVIQAESQGGGIWSSGAVELTGASITLSDNSTAGWGGGAIYTTQTVSIGGSGSIVTIKDNVAGYNPAGEVTGDYATGGAISSDDTTTLTGEIIILSGNRAVDAGGGIYSLKNAVVNGRLFADGNKAASGGAIYAGDDVTVDGDAELTSNATAGSGGGFAAGGNATVTGNLTADRNEAGDDGGVIRASGSVAVGGDVRLTDNRAGLEGGAIYAAGDILLNSAAAITGNQAGGNGGALWSGGSLTLNAARTATLISDNRAGGAGGAIYVGPAALTLNAIGGDIVFSGNTQNAAGTPQANAVYIDNLGGGGSANLNAEAGRGIVFYDPIQSNAANGLIAVAKNGLGTIRFDGANYANSEDRWSQVFADTTVSAGTFEVANKAVYGALSSDAVTPTAPTSFTSAAGAVVGGGLVGTIRADTVTLNGNLSIAGRHDPLSGYSVFNVVANNAAFGGGTIHFNTFLNDGLTQNTDLLVLNLNGATASGQASLHVTAMPGSPGAYTPGDGILLVRTDSGVTPDGTFVLGNRVAAGAYDYFLYRGGRESDPADVNNWYLRSVTPADPPPRPELPVNVAIQPLALQYGYAMLDTLHERVGETWTSPLAPVTEERTVRCKDRSQNFRCSVRVPAARANGADQRTTDATGWAGSGWARLIGSRGIHDRDNYWKGGPDYSYTLSGIQAGLDIYARERGDGTLDKAGVYVGYGQIDASVRGQPGAYYGHKAGTVDMDAYTLGGYWTHFSPSGWYTDTVVQGTWYTDTQARSVLSATLKPDGFGILGSFEAGYSFKLGSGWTLEPQAQLAYQSVTFDDARDSFGRFHFQDGDSLRGRLGVRLTKTGNMAGEGQPPRLVKGWLRANVWHEFLGNTKTTVEGFHGENLLAMRSSLKGTWGEIGAGVTAQVSEKASLFAAGSYRHSLDQKGSQGWDGRLGITVRW